jgi:hypothetical protein
LADQPPASGQTETLTAKGGALEWITRDAVDRIEINVQVARASATQRFEGRADYLMKVFRYDGLNFVNLPMENQIDVREFAPMKSSSRISRHGCSIRRGSWSLIAGPSFCRIAFSRQRHQCDPCADKPRRQGSRAVFR